MSGQNDDLIQKEPGIYTDIKFDEYKRIDAINHSTLKAFASTCPKIFKYHQDNGTLFKETEALIDGRIIHECILEPDHFDDKYVHTPIEWEPYRDKLPPKTVKKLEEKGDDFMFRKNTNAYKYIQALFKSELKEHQEPLDYLKWYQFREMRKSIQNNTACQKLFEGARFEVTLVWIDEVTGLKCKGRLDIDSEMRGYFADLKTTKSANPKDFYWDARRYNYYSAAAFYMDGAIQLGHKDFKAAMWLAIEKEEPYYVQPFYVRAGSDWIIEGRKWYRKQIEKLHYCKSTGDWHGYHDEINNDFNLYQLPDLMTDR